MRKRKSLAAVLTAFALSLSISASVFAENESPAESSAPAAEAESETEIDLGELAAEVDELENRLSAIEGVLPAAADCARGNGALKASTLKEFEILSALVRLRAEASKADAERSELEFRLISALASPKAEAFGITYERPSVAGGTESEIFRKGYSCFDDFSARNGSDSPSILDGEKSRCVPKRFSNSEEKNRVSFRRNRISRETLRGGKRGISPLVSRLDFVFGCGCSVFSLLRKTCLSVTASPKYLRPPRFRVF